MNNLEEPYYCLYRSGEKFIDMTEELSYFAPGAKTVIGPNNSGKHMLCSMIRCCLDKRLSFSEMFGAEAAKRLEDEMHIKLNGYHVITLDFTGFNEKSYDRALQYLSRKMANLYYSFREILFDTKEFGLLSRDGALNIIEGCNDEKVLKHCLRSLISDLSRSRNQQQCRVKPVVIIEEYNRLMIAACCYGYKNKMDDFLSEFFCIEPYYDVFCLLKTGYESQDCKSYSLHHSAYTKMYYQIECLRKICEMNGVPVPDKYEKQLNKYIDEDVYCLELHDASYDVLQNQTTEPSDSAIDENRIRFLKKMQANIKIEQEEELRKKVERERQEREKYKLDLPNSICFPTRNAGARGFHISEELPGYQEKERYLRNLYTKYGKNADKREIYHIMHNINEKVHTDWDESKDKIIQKIAQKYEWRWKRISIDEKDGYWRRIQTSAQAEEDQMHSLQMTKVYVSVNDDIHLSKLFLDAVEEMLANANNAFHAKVSVYKRSDAICFWVSQHDFFLLEKLFHYHEAEISCKLPFIAYRGKLGIGREMASWESQSGEQINLIANYFSLKDSVEEISLNEMYSLFVKGWNGDLEDNHPMTKAYKYKNAQILLVLLDSIDAATGNTVIDDDHLLLQDDEDLNNVICEYNCWADVGSRYINAVKRRNHKA